MHPPSLLTTFLFSFEDQLQKKIGEYYQSHARLLVPGVQGGNGEYSVSLRPALLPYSGLLQIAFVLLCGTSTLNALSLVFLQQVPMFKHHRYQQPQVLPCGIWWGWGL